MLPLGAANGAPWEGGTDWLSKNEATGVSDDGQLEIVNEAAHAESAGGSKFLSSYQKSSTWALGCGDGPEVVETDEDLTLTAYSEGTSFYDLNLPDGCDVPGRHLIAWMGAEPYDDLVLTMVTRAGWTKLDPTSGSTWFWKRLGGEDGTDPTGYPAEDAVEAIEVDDALSVTPVVCATVLLVENLYDEGSSNPGPHFASNPGVQSADPPALVDQDWDTCSEEQLTLIGIRAEQPVTRDTDDFFAESGTDEKTAPDATLLSLRADWKVAAEQAEDPEAYTVSDMSGLKDTSWTILLRGGKYADPAAGFVASTDREEGPHNQPHMVRIKFKVTDSDNGAYFTYLWQGCVEEGIDKGGGGKIAYIVAGTFINLEGQSQQALGFDLVEGDYYYMLIDLTGDVQRMKVWPITSPIPAAWDQTFAFAAGNNDFAYLALIVEIVAGSGFDIDEIHIGYGTEEGSSGRVYIGIADGSTTQYASPLQWGAGGPKVYVDGYLTQLAGFDASIWLFTFDRAPSYGARIEVEV